MQELWTKLSGQPYQTTTHSQCTAPSNWRGRVQNPTTVLSPEAVTCRTRPYTTFTSILTSTHEAFIVLRATSVVHQRVICNVLFGCLTECIAFDTLKHLQEMTASSWLSTHDHVQSLHARDTSSHALDTCISRKPSQQTYEFQLQEAARKSLGQLWCICARHSEDTAMSQKHSCTCVAKNGLLLARERPTAFQAAIRIALKSGGVWKTSSLPQPTIPEANWPVISVSKAFGCLSLYWPCEELWRL